MANNMPEKAKLTEDEIMGELGDVYYSDYAGTVSVRRARIKALLKVAYEKMAGVAIPLIEKRAREKLFGEIERYFSKMPTEGTTIIISNTLEVMTWWQALKSGE